MAKSSKAAFTRIATTVTARYYPTSGATDGFYLDGRLTGRREHRAADITLDREDRGFFNAVYAHLAGNAQEDSANSQVKKSLDKIMAEVKAPGHNIDAEINELAECAVSVVGRIALKHDGMRQPYFAGILVRDSEMAAVTMGNGCAYLYRGDVLYPLTTDDYALEAIDYAGKPVNGLDIYCAGVAGTVRYSNIAQLQMDDCLIVCNRDVMEALGQREVLRMLYEAEDQADAAGMIITAAAAKLPGTPMQFMIGFVENITSADRTARIGASRSHGDTAPASFATAAFGRGKPAAGRATAEAGKEEAAPDLMYTTPAGGTGKAGRGKPSERTQPVPQTTPGGHETDKDADRQPDQFDDEEDVFGDEIDTYGRGRRIAFYVIIAAVCIGCLVLIYNMLFNRGDQDPAVTTTTAPVASTATASATSGTATTGSQPSDTTDPAATTTESTPTTATETTISILAEHVVVAGDTPWEIAEEYYGRASFDLIRKIMAANGVEGDPEDFTIRVGDVLIIPAE